MQHGPRGRCATGVVLDERGSVMAGPAPKNRSSRRRRNEPARGEWVTLPTDPLPDAPSLPRPTPKGGWGVQAKRAWKLWWGDPVVHMWSESDAESVEELVMMVHEFYESPSASALTQIRLIKKSLGLSPDGRKDLRWQYADEVEAEVTPLRAVAGDKRPLPVDPNA